MNSLERCQAVLHHQIPDRVPVDLHNFLSAIFLAGFPLGQALQDGEMLAESQLKAWKEFQHDMLLVENGVVAVSSRDGLTPTPWGPVLGPLVSALYSCAGAGSIVGPFARLRPGTELGNAVHIGNFVEVKNSS